MTEIKEGEEDFFRGVGLGWVVWIRLCVLSLHTSVSSYFFSGFYNCVIGDERITPCLPFPDSCTNHRFAKT